MRVSVSEESTIHIQNTWKHLSSHLSAAGLSVTSSTSNQFSPCSSSLILSTACTPATPAAPTSPARNRYRARAGTGFNTHAGFPSRLVRSRRLRRPRSPRQPQTQSLPHRRGQQEKAAPSPRLRGRSFAVMYRVGTSRRVVFLKLPLTGRPGLPTSAHTCYDRYSSLPVDRIASVAIANDHRGSGAVDALYCRA